MAGIAPIMPFLRPLAPPRPSTIRQFLQFSTTTFRCQSQHEETRQSREATFAFEPEAPGPQQDRNLIASQTAHVSYPPPEFVSDPRPKISKGSRRSSRPFVDRSYLKTAAEAPGYGTRPPLNPAPVEFLPEDKSAPNLPYFVTRTRSHELPVYEDAKRGGNLELTYVKKVDGNLPLLRDALRERLGLDSKHAIVNDRTRHVVIKGHYKQEVLQFLRERRF